ncbi:MAG: hypothetical protein KDD41_03990 [Flavobacteriales bacterium]|nr:hypothetical protein [Flavobacteriales bacterium]
MKKHAINILFCCLVYSLAAQNAAADLNMVRQSFMNAGQIGFEVEVYHYPTKNSGGELLSKGVMRKSGDNYYSSFRNDKMILNKSKGTVIIDENYKEVTYFPPGKSKQEPQQMSLPDSLFDRFEYAGKVNGLKKYAYRSDDDQAAILKTELFINENNQLHKLIYYYNKDSKEVSYNAYKVEILYKNIMTANISKDYFDISDIISWSNNKVHLTKKYSGYTLLH